MERVGGKWKLRSKNFSILGPPTIGFCLSRFLKRINKVRTFCDIFTFDACVCLRRAEIFLSRILFEWDYTLLGVRVIPCCIGNMVIGIHYYYYAWKYSTIWNIIFCLLPICWVFFFAYVSYDSKNKKRLVEKKIRENFGRKFFLTNFKIIQTQAN